MAMMPMMAKAPKITTLLIAVFFIEKESCTLKRQQVPIVFSKRNAFCEHTFQNCAGGGVL
jgi:hypothetical protein